MVSNVSHRSDEGQQEILWSISWLKAGWLSWLDRQRDRHKSSQVQAGEHVPHELGRDTRSPDRCGQREEQESYEL